MTERKNGIVHKVLQPAGWPEPKGYVNGVSATGRMVFTGGLIGWDENGHFPDGFVGQVRQALKNTLAVLEAGGAGPEHIVRMTWYVTDIEAYLASGKDLGTVYRDLLGRAYPPMALVQVVRLVEPAAKVEIETTAMVPA